MYLLNDSYLPRCYPTLAGFQFHFCSNFPHALVIYKEYVLFL